MATTTRSATGLLTRRRAHSSPRRLARAVEILRVLRRSGASRLLSSVRDDEAARAVGVRIREGFEELGPTFCKLGQLLSTRPDLLPLTVIEELSSLRSRVTPLGPTEVFEVIETELGAPWQSVFANIDPEPLATGTVGQAHRGRLLDGTPVVLKAQRPSAAGTIERDLALLRSLTGVVRRWVPVVDLTALVEDLAASLTAELDFEQESRNLQRLDGVLAGFSRLGVPGVHGSLCSARLLVMDEVSGVPISDLPAGNGRVEAATELVAAFVHQLLVVGFFHADPHPGNLFWSQGKVWLVDLGLVGEIDRSSRRRLGLLMLSFWHGDASFVADLVLGAAPAKARARIDRPAFVRDIEALITESRRDVDEFEVGVLVQRVVQISLRHRVPVPTELALVGKALSELQYTLSLLDPELDLFEAARRPVAHAVVVGLAKQWDVTRLGYELVKAHHRLGHALGELGGSPSTRPESLGIRDPLRRSARSLPLVLAGVFAFALAADRSRGRNLDQSMGGMPQRPGPPSLS